MLLASKAVRQGYPISYACKTFNLSTATWYKYQHLYADGGERAWHGK